MRIGLSIAGGRPLPDVLTAIEDAGAAGYAHVWPNETGSWDPLTVLSALGGRAPDVELGTAVVATFPRHPLALAAQVLTTQAATGGRLTLGLGTSHPWVVESRYGLRWDRPADRVREFLDVLTPALRGEDVDVAGTTVGARGGVDAPGVEPPPVLLAAHGPRMLALAGERTAGVITLWARPEYVADFVVPGVDAGRAVGSPPARIVVGLNAAVTADPDTLLADAAEHFALGSTMPSYRGTLDRQGAGGIEDMIVAGDEETVVAQVRRHADAGVTDLILFPTGSPAERERTVALFGGLVPATRPHVRRPAGPTVSS
ncbi:TIGR03564 family F420-dependent LLM class oxidoreductase [Pseudonocardia endophytica]|uniref:F420-dependent oxidoreductase-like protein n=1 Tax=Pseudonocardia endophytica TaxID=401976 RepID=A0A4R1HM04_PSEEN|nr:TIGR03564 family F420-dependent LLM class oxidoreductase [Pseudonocardia endophytica]TCK22141.1 F420-dependent oxidoreductase-like protein [Pseudonocardia endophytica]